MGHAWADPGQRGRLRFGPTPPSSADRPGAATHIGYSGGRRRFTVYTRIRRHPLRDLPSAPASSNRSGGHLRPCRQPKGVRPDPVGGTVDNRFAVPLHGVVPAQTSGFVAPRFDDSSRRMAPPAWQYVVLVDLRQQHRRPFRTVSVTSRFTSPVACSRRLPTLWFSPAAPFPSSEPQALLLV